MAEADAFSELMAKLDYPMVIVTVASGGERSGCLVGFGSQVSIRPPRYLVCLSEQNHTFGVAGKAEVLAVHFPSAGQRALAELFGGETDDEVDKFKRCAWTAGPHDVPLLDDVEHRFVGRVVETVPFGDHTGFVLEPLMVERGGDTDGMMFQQVRDIDPGHDP